MWANYPSTLPLFERAWKQRRHGLWWLAQCMRQRRRPPVVLVWPDMPSRRTTLHKITRELGWELTNRKRTSAVIGIKFEDTTYKSTAAIPAALHNAATWWNFHCNDISKVTLEIQHQAAFGYGMRVDPITHRGPLVIKSDANAKHDGELIQGPIKLNGIKKNVVYQREIDNRDENGNYFDFRVVFICGAIPVVYKKVKKTDTRFTNQTSEVELLKESPFTIEEEACMRLLAKGMSVDYAEFDALRDRNSNQLYVVDVNPTPWGPPDQLAPALQEKAIAAMASCFQSIF